MGLDKQWCSPWLPAGVKSGQSFLAANTGHKGFKITADFFGMCWVELTAVIAGWILISRLLPCHGHAGLPVRGACSSSGAAFALGARRGAYQAALLGLGML